MFVYDRKTLVNMKISQLRQKLRFHRLGWNHILNKEEMIKKLLTVRRNLREEIKKENEKAIDFNELSKVALIEIAKGKGIKIVSRDTKQKIIEKLGV